MDHRRAAVLMAVAVMSVATGVAGDIAADRAECSNTLIGLATCLTYVQDEAVAPTPDCCAGLKTLLQTSRKCLCVLVKDRDDPSLGLKINVTKALSLPSLCNAPANISECPRLLNLPPNSKDAQIFEQFGKQSGGSSSGAPATGGAQPQKSGAAGPENRRWLGVDGVGGAGGARAAAVLLLSSAAVVPLAAPLLLLLLLVAV